MFFALAAERKIGAHYVDTIGDAHGEDQHDRE